MTFDFNEYYINLFTMRVFQSILIFIATILLIVVTIIQNRKKKFVKKDKIVLVLIHSVAFYFLIGSVLNINFDLYRDQNASAMFEEGIIQSISRSENHRAKFLHDGDFVWGHDIVIEDTVYHVLTKGTFSEGDQVIIEYLPNSNVVISIHHVDRLINN